MHTHTTIHTHACMHAHTHTHTHTHTQTHTHTYIHICTPTHNHTPTSTHTDTHRHAHAHTHTDTHMQTHTPTKTQAHSSVIYYLSHSVVTAAFFLCFLCIAAESVHVVYMWLPYFLHDDAIIATQNGFRTHLFAAPQRQLVWQQHCVNDSICYNVILLLRPKNAIAASLCERSLAV